MAIAVTRVSEAVKRNFSKFFQVLRRWMTCRAPIDGPSVNAWLGLLPIFCEFFSLPRLSSTLALVFRGAVRCRIRSRTCRYFEQQLPADRAARRCRLTSSLEVCKPVCQEK